KWMFNQKACGEYLGIEGGKEDGHDGGFIRETITRTGAFIMGKRMFEEGEVSWPEDLYKANVYVLTHEEREPWVQKGSTTFYFINDGIHSALEKAEQSAKGKDMRIQGGANTIQQFLNAGLVDEIFIHIAPVFVGSGIRPFDGIDHGELPTHGRADGLGFGGRRLAQWQRLIPFLFCVQPHPTTGQ